MFRACLLSTLKNKSFQKQIQPINFQIQQRWRSSKILDYKQNNKITQLTDPDNNMTIDELARSIDTTLTPEQRINVEKIKKKMKGGARSPRCKF